MDQEENLFQPVNFLEEDDFIRARMASPGLAADGLYHRLYRGAKIEMVRRQRERVKGAL